MVHLESAREERIEFYVNIENTGYRDSGQFGVVTVVLLNGQPQTPTFEQIDNLPAQTVENVQVATITDFGGRETPMNRFHVTVWLDPPTADRPWGEVYESNEEDNVAQGHFLVPDF